jgi:hypothetical protein
MYDYRSKVWRLAKIERATFSPKGDEPVAPTLLYVFRVLGAEFFSFWVTAVPRRIELTLEFRRAVE